MPKLKQPKGRGRKMDVMEETADRDSPHSSFSSLDMVIPETQQYTSQSQVSCDDDLKKKRVRVSKKDIPDYQWTEETETTLADLVKENPMLFDKKHKEWINKVLKDSRWAYIGSQLEPPATAAQCKKRYENLRTRVGKIMKKEKKSGAGQAQRSGRDDFIMDTWSFLIQHIVRGETVASEEFRGSEGGATTASEVDDDVRSTGTRSQASTTTRKDKGKGSCRTLDTSHSDTYVSEKDFSNILRNLVSKADSSTPTFMGQHKIVHDFSCLLEGYMRAIPVHRWHEFQIVPQSHTTLQGRDSGLAAGTATILRDLGRPTATATFTAPCASPCASATPSATVTLAAPSPAVNLAAPSPAVTLATPSPAVTLATPSPAATLAVPSTRTLACTARAAATASSSQS
ncbi:uncharacterized protein [Palaemon carinicauda]|uniref:uncharacterized protein n=1 Tax=Palaemon carinicauda TaxID=392227 RepID=UPI0035B5DFB0